MHRVLLSILDYVTGWIGEAIIGAISAVAVYSIARSLPGRGGTRIEMTFAIAGIVGMGMMDVAVTLHNRLLGGVALILCGWVVLPIVLIPAVLVWRLVDSCGRRTPKE